MKTLNDVNKKNDVKSKAAEEVKAEPEKIDFSKVKIEPLFEEAVDFDTFSKSDFRAVKVKECVAVPKSKKLLQFTLDDGTGTDRTILSGIHSFYEPEELVGKEYKKNGWMMLVSTKGDISMDEKIVKVLNEMSEFLSIAQMKKLQEVILKTFAENEAEHSNISNDEFLDMFLAAKRVEGCSDRTIQYYRVTIEHMFTQIETAVRKITTEEIRVYLAEYQKRNNCSNVTIDNVRRNISSFFSWLEEEDYILKSPTKRIHKIKTKKVVKNTISDEGIEKLRDNCREIRDLAIIDLLYSTGIRVGELVNLNIDDIDLEGRECVVYGKGDKERRVYFDAKAKVHLKKYIDTRKDNNVALFVTLDAPYDRLKISGVEIRLRELGRKLNLEKIHPHKFRRTMATRAIDKGMPIEQVQKILGHSQIDTTMQYAMVNQNNVKSSHQKYIA